MSDIIPQMRPEQKWREQGFIIDPRPEEIQMMAGLEAVGTLTIGLKTITHDRRGGRIIPTVQVIIALNGQVCDLPPSMVHDLIPRLEVMCAAADKLNARKDH
jgi:hypothetical protein